VLEVLRELGIGFVAYSPLGRGFLTGTIRSTEELPDGDYRKTNPRFFDENFQHNLSSADELRDISADVGATPAQVALAWLLAKGSDIVPIPGAKRVTRLEENVGADTVKLAPDQLARLDQLTPPVGGRHAEAQMGWIDRLGR
jgi:aryl-alcohol dehydrogenase-like predicted oxidoreductase